uniref:DNA-dependent RNA polymerase ii largest subunit n=1 Tax=Colletotrichum fructicola (strain Nara gc5) TaxID=1213859 RepID=L2FEI0_COLFN
MHQHQDTASNGGRWIMPAPSRPSGFVPSNSAPVSGTWQQSPGVSPANFWPQPSMPTHMGYPPAGLPPPASALHMAANQPPIAPSYHMASPVHYSASPINQTPASSGPWVPTLLSHHMASPVHRMASPFHHSASPVHHMTTPVHHLVSPIRHMAASPVQYTPSSSVYHTASPRRHTAFPSHHQTSPVHHMATPFHHTASPVQYTPSSVHHMASPVHNGSPHLNSSQTIFPPSQPILPMSSQTTSLPPSQTLSPTRLPTTPIRMMSPLHGSHHSSPALGFAPFSPGGLSYAPNSPCLSVSTVSTRHRAARGNDNGNPRQRKHRPGVHPAVAQFHVIRNKLIDLDHFLRPKPRRRVPTPPHTLRLTVRPANALDKFSGDRAEIIGSLSARDATWAGLKGLGCKAGTLWLNFTSAEAMQRFQRSDDPFEEELCLSLSSKARDLEAVLGVTIDTLQSAETRFYVEIIFYGCKAERNMRGRRDWFEEPFGIQVHSVTVRWSRLIVSFSDVEQAWKLLQAYETAKDDFYVNYRLAMARCFNCTKDHPSKECPVKDKEKEKQCGNCLGRHSVTSPRCFAEAVADMRRFCAEIDNADVEWYIGKIRSLKQQNERPPADAPQYVDLTGSTEDTVGNNEDMYNDVDLKDSDYDQVFSAIESNSQPAEGKGAPTAARSSKTSSVRKPLAPKSANASSKPQSGCNKAKSTTSAPAPNARNAAAGKSINRQQCKEGTRKRLASTAVPGSTRPKTRVRTDKSNSTNTNTNFSANTAKTKSSRSGRRKRLQEQKDAEEESLNTQKATEPKPSDKSTAKSDKQRVQKATSSKHATTKSNDRARTTPIRPASSASPAATAPTPSVHNTDQPSPVASPGEGMVEYFGTSSPATIQSLDVAASLTPVYPRTSDRDNSQTSLSNSSLPGSAAASFSESAFSFTGTADSPFTGSAASFTRVSASPGSDAFTAPSQCMSTSFPSPTTSSGNLVPTGLPPLSTLGQASNASSLSSPATPSRSGTVAQAVIPNALGVIVNEGSPSRVSKPAAEGLALAKASSGTNPTTVLTPPPSSQPPTAAQSSVHPSGFRQKTVDKSRNYDQTPCRSSRASKPASAAQLQLIGVAEKRMVMSSMWPELKGPQSTGGDDVTKEMAWLGDGWDTAWIGSLV